MTAKKTLTQQELRKVMNNTKQKLGVEKKKIESPLAKYNLAGQLTCVICKFIVGNESIWPVHINSKKHKENLEKAKQQLERAKLFASSIKRSGSPVRDSQPVKKVKSILKNYIQTPEPPPQTKAKLPEDFFDSKSTPTVNGVANGISSSSKPSTSAVPTESIKIEEGNEEEKQQKGKDNSTTLPEGFFDDPVLDARVRNVEYKNPIEEEWEKFKKEIKEEEAQANQIIAEDQEEATTKRQEDVIEEQMQRLSKVMDLVKLKEKMQAAERRQANVEKESSSSDDEDFDEFLDWRAKKSYK